MSNVDESIVEDAALSWFRELGYAVAHGPHLAPGEAAAEREAFSDVVLVGRLQAAIQRLNPKIPVALPDSPWIRQQRAHGCVCLNRLFPPRQSPEFTGNHRALFARMAGRPAMSDESKAALAGATAARGGLESAKIHLHNIDISHQRH